MSITWNGVSSDTIGVIVEKIPNRYIPTRRFSPQQVAGRNGNILLVDKAFPNVEQEYEVYLSAESQGLPSVARACAEWLMGPDGYCRLTDSYDTTVYREAFLLGGFDIENILNKFGRCTITFSCKPQKYLLTGDTPIEIPDGTTTTYTGDVVQFDVITGASITSLSTTLSPIQDLHGYDFPWPAGGGVNILPTVDQRGNGFIDNYRLLSDGTTVFMGTYYISQYFPVTPGKTYTYSVVNYGSETSSCAAFYDSEYNFISAITGKPNGNEAVAPSNAAYMRASNIKPGDDLYYTLNEGPYANICPISGRTGVSVYVGPTQDQQDATTYAVDWTTEAGTVYGGTLDVVTGVLTVDRVMWEPDNSASCILSSQTSDVCVFDASLVNNSLPNAASPSNIISNRFSTTIASGKPGRMVLAGSHLYFVIAKSELSSYNQTGARAWLVANPTQFCYKLATPLTYQLTPQEVEALVGTNNVWSSSGDVSVTVTTLLGGIVTNPTPFEARPLLTVSGVGEITINGKSIHILESVSDFEIDCETMEAEDNSKIYCMDFPELSGGENEIVGDGSITALTVTPRWWTL